MVDVPQLKRFGIANQNTKDVAVADKAVLEFLDNYKDWKEVVGYMVDGEDGELLYGAALSTFLGNLCISSNLSIEVVECKNTLFDRFTI